MSKKIIIIAAVLVAIIAALPLVGNMGVKKIIDERIVMLESNIKFGKQIILRNPT